MSTRATAKAQAAEEGGARVVADPYADLAAPEPLPSSDAAHSTYRQVDPPKDVVPPPGPMVEQTLGFPKEASE